MSKEFQNVQEFNEKIIGLKQSMYLDYERAKWFNNVINEELSEFNAANLKLRKLCEAGSFKLAGKVVMNDNMREAQAEMADAIIDLIYFAYGRLYEIGIEDFEFDAMWDEVQQCNMAKVKGNKGRGSDEDAVKPEGWTPPEKNFAAILDKDASALMPKVVKTIESVAWQKHIDAETLDAIPSAFIEAVRLCIKKSQDYNKGQGKPQSRKEYFPFGLLSYAQMLHTKTQRLNSLAQQTKTPNNESIRDTLIDMINYASFAIDAIDKGEI